MFNSELVLFHGNANIDLAKKISTHIGLPLGKILVSSFADEETRVEIDSNIRGHDVFIIQPTCSPANHHLMEALIIADACRRASAQRITLVAPYFGYARQERKTVSRAPITAKLVADLITVAGYNRVLTIELHTSALQGFFNIPVDHLFTKPIFGNYFKNNVDNVIVVSPDAGGVERARAFAKYLDCNLAIVDKRRDQPNVSEVHNIIGEVKGKKCLLIDDIIDTGGSLCKAAVALMEHGAIDVVAAVTHPVLSKNAVELIEASPISEIVVTDTIPLNNKARKLSKIKVLSVAELLAEAIKRIHNSDSISSLFV